MPLENLKNVGDLCYEFSLAVAAIDPAAKMQIAAVDLWRKAAEAGNTKYSTLLIAWADTNADLLAQVLTPAEVAKLIPSALKEPENVATLHEAGAKTLTALCMLKP